MEALIKIYSDVDCLKELEIVDGNYRIKHSFPDIIDTTYYQTLFVKNVGDHTAYEVSLSCNNVVDVIISLQPPSTLEPNQVFFCVIGYPLTNGRNEDIVVDLTLNYDNMLDGGVANE